MWYSGLILFIFLLFQLLPAEWHTEDYGKWAVVRFEHTPFPDTSISLSGFNSSTVFIFIPDGYQPYSEIDLIVDHHGHGAIIDPENEEKSSYPELHRQAYQLYESRKNAILIMPQAARDRASSSAGRFSRYGMFAAFIGEVCAFLRNERIVSDEAKLGQIHLNSFSGGYLITAMDISANPPELISHIKSVHLWDSFYGQQDIFYNWVLKQKGYFFNTFTPEGGTRVLSEQMRDSLRTLGIECFHALPIIDELPKVIIEPTDKYHNDVSRGEFAYGRYLKKLPLPDIDLTAAEAAVLCIRKKRFAYLLGTIQKQSSSRLSIMVFRKPKRLVSACR